MLGDLGDGGVGNVEAWGVDHTCEALPTVAGWGGLGSVGESRECWGRGSWSGGMGV